MSFSGKDSLKGGIHPHSWFQVPCPLFLFQPLHLQAITVLFTLREMPGKPFLPALKKLLPACTQVSSAQHPATPLSPDPQGSGSLPGSSLNMPVPRPGQGRECSQDWGAAPGDTAGSSGSWRRSPGTPV